MICLQRSSVYLMTGPSQKSIRILCTSIGVLFFSIATPPNSNASSLNDKDFQIQAIVLSNLGPGLSFSYQFSKNLWLSLEGQSLSRDMSEDSNDGSATKKSGFDSQTSYLSIRYYLASVDGLFFQTGLVNRNWEAKKEIYSKQSGQRKAIYRVDYLVVDTTLELAKTGFSVVVLRHQ